MKRSYSDSDTNPERRIRRLQDLSEEFTDLEDRQSPQPYNPFDTASLLEEAALDFDDSAPALASNVESSTELKCLYSKEKVGREFVASSDDSSSTEVIHTPPDSVTFLNLTPSYCMAESYELIESTCTTPLPPEGASCKPEHYSDHSGSSKSIVVITDSSEQSGNGNSLTESRRLTETDVKASFQSNSSEENANVQSDSTSFRAGYDPLTSSDERPPSRFLVAGFEQQEATPLLAQDVELDTSWRKRALEPFVFLYALTSFFGLLTLPHVLMDRGCLVDLNYTMEICYNLTSHPTILNEVQTKANYMTLYNILIVLISSSFLAILMGSWSNKYGRVSPIVLAIIGNILGVIGQLLFVLNPKLSIVTVLFSAIPFGCFGGIVVVMSSVYTMASEKTRKTERILKYVTIEAAFSVGMPFGILASELILSYFGTLAVYCVELFLHCICLIYVFICIRDNRLNRQDAGLWKKFKDFFSLRSVLDNFRVCCKERPNRGKSQLWLLFTSMTCVQLHIISVGALLFLYTNKLFGWTFGHFAIAINITAVASALAMILASSVLKNCCPLGEMTLGIIGLISMGLQSILRSASVYPAIFILSLTIGCLSGLVAPTIRSKISTLVDKDEVGKVLACLAVFEFLTPVPLALIFSAGYNTYLATHPLIPFMGATTLVVLPLFTFIWIRHVASLANPVASLQ